MDNQSDRQQDPMSYKAAKVAYQLVESTERFLTTIGELSTQSIGAMGNNVNDNIKRVIQQYEHVCMIVNALQSISIFVADPQNRSSLTTAAASASTSSSTALSRIHSQLSALQIDDSAARESLSQLGLLTQQSKLVDVKLEDSGNVGPQPMQISPPPASTKELDDEKRELALKRKKFDEEREEFERERKRLMMEKESAAQKLQEQQLFEQRELFVQQQQQQQQQQLQLQLQQKQKQQQQQQQQIHLQLQQQRHEQRILELRKQEQEKAQREQQEMAQREQQEKIQREQQEKIQREQQEKAQREQQEKAQREQQEKAQREQQEKKNLAKQKQQIHILSTDQFLEQFEKTAQAFAQSINMNIDNVWESMLIHALPKDKLPWANETIIGKKHSWRYAKQMYHMKYANKSNVGNFAGAGGASFSIPTAPTAAFAATNAVVQATTSAPSSTTAVVSTANAPSITTTTTVGGPLTPLQRLLARPAPSATNPLKERDQRRVADYCQHLLSLEMKFYDTIEEYNKRYMRYCTIANVDLTGKSFIERYIRSLDPKYREIVRTALQLHEEPLNHIKDVMAVAEKTVNAYIAAYPARSSAPYSQNCIHNRNINQTA